MYMNRFIMWTIIFVVVGLVLYGIGITLLGAKNFGSRLNNDSVQIVDLYRK